MFVQEATVALESMEAKNITPLSQQNTEHLTTVNQADIVSQARNKQIAELEKIPVKEQSRGFEISL